MRKSSVKIALCFASLLLIFISASGQQPAAPPKPPPPPPQNAPGTNAPAAGAVATFTTGTQLVVEEVAVTDKSGKPIEGLTKKDFTVTEDGVAQEVAFLEYENLPDDSGPQLQTRPETPLVVEPLEKLTRTEIAPEPPGDIQLHNRRLLCLYFDMSSMGQADQLRALSGAEKFIRTMAPEDIMAIMQYEGAAVEVLTDFTDSKEKLLSIIETIIVGEGQGFGETSSDAGAADTGAAFGQDDSEFNIFTTDRQLSAIQTACKMLGGRNEKKALNYFASGLQLNGVDNQAQLHATENACLRSGVSIWPIDSRGLVATPPMGDLSQRGPSGNGIFTGQSAMAFSTRLAQTQDTLFTLAADTGGKALLDNNDLERGILNAERSMASYYILGYYSKNTNLDGKFRKIKITVGGDLNAKLDYRQGYYGNKTYNKFTTADKERQLEDALMAGDPITELTIAVEMDFFELNRAEYFVPMMVKIPGRELAIAKQRFGAEHTVIDFIGEVKDDFGSTVQNIRDKVDSKISDFTAQELAKRPIEYATGFTLLPGKYTVKILARDAETGRIGTFQQTYVIPNLMKETKRIPISSVVLSSERQNLKDALFNALKDKDRAETANPLVTDGQKLIPSVTRVFSKTKDMYVYLQAYEQSADTVRPVVAFVTFFKGQTKVYETAPIEVTTPSEPKLKTLPLRFTVPLGSLEPGQYDCQITVLDPEGQKTAFWQDKVQIIQ